MATRQESLTQSSQAGRDAQHPVVTGEIVMTAVDLRTPRAAPRGAAVSEPDMPVQREVAVENRKRASERITVPGGGRRGPIPG